MARRKKIDHVRIEDIAQRLDVTEAAVLSWRRYDATFPKPLAIVSGEPIWHWADIEAWKKV